MKLYKCQKFHPEAAQWDAFIPCKPFDAKVCSLCGEVVSDWPKWKVIAWAALIGWWWNGAVAVRAE